MIGKKYWRKIYVEDVIESIDQSSFEVHQVRFQVNPIAENSERYSNKSFQVKECLHRTPDVIFIGELIHPKSVKSFFFLLKVGLRRCLATAHGESPELIVERFIYDDQIPSPLIGNLDIIVQMNRINSGGKISRRVTRITEIKKERQIGFNERINTLPEASNLTFIDIFLRDPIKDQLVKSYNSINELYIKSDAIKKMNLLRGEYISDNDFIVEIKKIKSILGNLLETNTCELGAIIKIFHRFWQDLEINMDLNSFKNFL